MNIKIYTDFSKRTNSTKVPASNVGTEVAVKLKEGTSIYNPSFILSSGGNKPQIKYVKWDSYYYYVNDVTITTDHLYQIDCTIDVLASFKSDILNTSAFVKYSSSIYNENILDSRLSMSGDVDVTRSGVQLYTRSATETYVARFVSSAPLDGSGVIAFRDDIDLKTFLSYFTDTDFLASIVFGGGVQKQLSGVYDALLEVYEFPFDVATNQSQADVYISNWKSPVGIHYYPNRTYNFGHRVDIPWQYDDFRRSSAFCSVFLWLPFVGFVQVNTDDIRTYSKLTIIMNVNGYNGIGSIDITECHLHIPISCARKVPCGTISTNSTQALVSSIGAVTSMGLGNVYGTVTGAFNTFLSSMQHNVGATSGGSGSEEAEWTLPFTTADPSYVYCFVLQHPTSEEPSNMTALYGRPVNEVTPLTELTGYVECTNASVNTTAPKNIKDEINTYLNGGVYIE